MRIITTLLTLLIFSYANVQPDDSTTNKKQKRNTEHLEEILLKPDPIGYDDDDPNVQAVLHELKSIYQAMIRPVEKQFRYADLRRHTMSDADIYAKPIVLLVGPWSTGKSTMINYLLGIEGALESLYTGAEPTTGDFTFLSYGDEYRTVEGVVLATDAGKPFASMEKFGQIFLEHLLGVEMAKPLLRNVTFIDTPGILENRRQQERGYPYNDVMRWLVHRSDLIFVVFDPTKLDVGWELETLFKQLKGKESVLRIILNKADSMSAQDLMRVYGALFWSLSPLINVTEPPRVYVGSFWGEPYHDDEVSQLLLREEKSLLHDMREVIRNRIYNKIAFVRQHAIRVRVHALLVDSYVAAYRRNKGMFGNNEELANTIVDDPESYNVFKTILSHPNVSIYDLPDADEYAEFFQINPLSEQMRISDHCTYFSGCATDKLNQAISHDLPVLLRRFQNPADYKKENCHSRECRAASKNAAAANTAPRKHATGAASAAAATPPPPPPPTGANKYRKSKEPTITENEPEPEKSGAKKSKKSTPSENEPVITENVPEPEKTGGAKKYRKSTLNENEPVVVSENEPEPENSGGKKYRKSTTIENEPVPVATENENEPEPEKSGAKKYRKSNVNENEPVVNENDAEPQNTGAKKYRKSTAIENEPVVVEKEPEPEKVTLAKKSKKKPESEEQPAKQAKSQKTQGRKENVEDEIKVKSTKIKTTSPASKTGDKKHTPSTPTQKHATASAPVASAKTDQETKFKCRYRKSCYEDGSPSPEAPSVTATVVKGKEPKPAKASISKPAREAVPSDSDIKSTILKPGCNKYRKACQEVDSDAAASSSTNTRRSEKGAPKEKVKITTPVISVPITVSAPATGSKCNKYRKDCVTSADSPSESIPQKAKPDKKEPRSQEPKPKKASEAKPSTIKTTTTTGEQKCNKYRKDCQQNNPEIAAAVIVEKQAKKHHEKSTPTPSPSPSTSSVKTKSVPTTVTKNVKCNKYRKACQEDQSTDEEPEEETPEPRVQHQHKSNEPAPTVVTAQSTTTGQEKCNKYRKSCPEYEGKNDKPSPSHSQATENDKPSPKAKHAPAPIKTSKPVAKKETATAPVPATKSSAPSGKCNKYRKDCQVNQDQEIEISKTKKSDNKAASSSEDVPVVSKQVHHHEPGTPCNKYRKSCRSEEKQTDDDDIPATPVVNTKSAKKTPAKTTTDSKKAAAKSAATTSKTEKPKKLCKKKNTTTKPQESEIKKSAASTSAQNKWRKQKPAEQLSSSTT